MNGHSSLRRALTVSLLFPAFAHGNGAQQASSTHLDGIFTELARNPDGLTYLREQAEQNNPHALFYLGLASELGRGTPVNAQFALSCYRAAGDRLREAAFNAGRLLYLSRKVDDAMNYLVVAAGAERADGIVKAMVVLGRIYERGESTLGRNYIAASRWYEAAARRKDPQAVGKMGEFLLYGIGRPANSRDAKIYLERAADMWNADAQYLLGVVFARGMVTPVNRTEASKWFMVAAMDSTDYRAKGEQYLAGLTEQERNSARRMADLWISAHPKQAPIDYTGIILQVR